MDTNRSLKVLAEPKVSSSRRNRRASESSLSDSAMNATKSKRKNHKNQAPSTYSPMVVDSDTTPRPQVVKQALDRLESERKTTEVDARIEGELTPQEVRDLKYVFDTFDSEHRGYIDADDLRRALRVMGFKITQDDLIEIIADVHGGSVTHREVTFQQFLELVVYKQADARDVHGELEQGFKMMDLGDKGHLTFDDIKRASQVAGLRFRDDTIREMMDEADTNGDDLISKGEFFQVMLQTNLF